MPLVKNKQTKKTLNIKVCRKQRLIYLPHFHSPQVTTINSLLYISPGFFLCIYKYVHAKKKISLHRFPTTCVFRQNYVVNIFNMPVAIDVDLYSYDKSRHHIKKQRLGCGPKMEEK